MAPSNSFPLSVTNVSKSFGALNAVNNVSLNLNEGEIFGLLGPNGAGKSTTINMIAGLTKFTIGSISVFGFDIQRGYKHTRRILGVVHQEIVPEQFFRVGAALKIHSGYYGVKDDPRWRNLLIERLELGPHLEKKFLRLSGGMKRRFMVAKALLHKPKLLILDEPTAGVDVELRRSIWEFIREINQAGVTILLTTHYLEEAEQLCNRIGVMKDGVLIALEETKQLISSLGEGYLNVRLLNRLHEIPAGLLASGATLLEENTALRLPIRGNQSVDTMLNEIRKAGLQIQHISSVEPHLEEVFVHLTSKNKKPELSY
jgi:ABC-2 type transport system ATP-binding protein